MAIKSKKGQVAGQIPVPVRILLILIGTVVFFAFFPVINGIIEAITATMTNDVVVFLVEMVPYVIMIGLFAWILRGEA